MCTKDLKSSHAYQVRQYTSRPPRIHVLNNNYVLSHRSMFELWGWGRDYSELETSISQEFPSQRMVCVCVCGVTVWSVVWVLCVCVWVCDDCSLCMYRSPTHGMTTPSKSSEVASRKNALWKDKKKYTRYINNSVQELNNILVVIYLKYLFHFLRLQKLSFLPLNGKVDVKNPTHEFYILEDYGDHPNTAPEDPLRVFFGRLITRGQRHLIKHYAVKDRVFIGNTSMDAQLSLIMANQAQVMSNYRLKYFLTSYM